MIRCDGCQDEIRGVDVALIRHTDGQHLRYCLACATKHPVYAQAVKDEGPDE